MTRSKKSFAQRRRAHLSPEILQGRRAAALQAGKSGIVTHVTIPPVCQATDVRPLTEVKPGTLWWQHCSWYIKAVQRAKQSDDALVM